MTLLERLAVLWRIYVTRPRRPMRYVAIGWKPDETFTKREVVNGVVEWSKEVK